MRVLHEVIFYTLDIPLTEQSIRASSDMDELSTMLNSEAQ